MSEPTAPDEPEVISNPDLDPTVEPEPDVEDDETETDET